MKHVDRTRRQLSRRIARRGFTLMEVLLTLILCAILLTVLWSLFGTYTRLFESGQARVERVQVVRAVMRQFSDDLSTVMVALITAPEPQSQPQAAANDPFATVPSAERNQLEQPNLSASAAPDVNATPFLGAAQSSPADPSLQPESMNTTAAPAGDAFLFVGTEHSLLVDVLTSPPPHLLPDDDAQASQSDAATASGPHAQEFQTVLYTFEDPLEANPGDGEPPPGLVRRQLPWELSRTAHLTRQTTANATSSSLPNAELFEARGFSPLSADELAEAEFSRDDVTWAKEVTAFRLRYYDGQDWRAEWDSRIKHHLPKAVEILIQLQDPHAHTLDSANGETHTTPAKPLLATGTGTEEAEFGDPDRPVLRQVIPVAIPARAHRALENNANALSFGDHLP